MRRGKGKGSEVRGSELRLPGKEKSDRPAEGAGEAPPTAVRRGSWGTGYRLGRGAREEEAERGSYPTSGYHGGAQAQVTTSGPPKRETPHCTQPGLSPAPMGGRDPTSPGPASPSPNCSSQGYPSIGQLDCSWWGAG